MEPDWHELVKIVQNSVKFLGMIMDDFLSWKHLISNIKSNVSRALFMLKQVNKILPTASLKALYHSMIQPHFTYGLLAWGNANQCDMNKMILLQKWAIRSITKSHYNSHTEPLLQKCNILKIQDQFNVEVTLFMHDYLNNTFPSFFNNISSHIRDNRENVQTRQTSPWIFHCSTNPKSGTSG